MKHHVHENRKGQITDGSLFGYSVLLAVFVGSYIIAPLIAIKMVAIGPFTVAAGALAYAMTFLSTDIVTEVYGKRYARNLVTCGFIGMLIVALLTQITVHLPAASFWDKHEPFNAIFGASHRIFLGSIEAYRTAQYLDIWIFARVRTWTDGKWLWLRNNLSTSLSKIVDIVIFMSIAFYGTMPVNDFIVTILSMWVIHIIISICDTPLVYLGVYILHKAYPELKE